MRKIKLDNVEYDIDAMSKEQLVALSDMIHAQMANIRVQIESASARYNDEGIKSDPEWFISARRALKGKGADHQIVQEAIGRANKRERKMSKPVSSYFMDVAKEVLTDREYDSIMRRAATRKEVADSYDGGV